MDLNAFDILSIFPRYPIITRVLQSDLINYVFYVHNIESKMVSPRVLLKKTFQFFNPPTTLISNYFVFKKLILTPHLIKSTTMRN